MKSHTNTSVPNPGTGDSIRISHSGWQEPSSLLPMMQQQRELDEKRSRQDIASGSSLCCMSTSSYTCKLRIIMETICFRYLAEEKLKSRLQKGLGNHPLAPAPFLRAPVQWQNVPVSVKGYDSPGGCHSCCDRSWKEK